MLLQYEGWGAKKEGTEARGGARRALPLILYVLYVSASANVKPPISD